MAPDLTSLGKHLPQSTRSVLGGYLNNLRQVHTTYDPRQSAETLKLQLLINAQKGIVIDTEARARDSHAASRQLYLWSDEQMGDDIRDIGDRLAFMMYQTGDLELRYARALENARGHMKELRNRENELTKLRDRCQGVEAHLAKLRPDHERFHSMRAEHNTTVQELEREERAMVSHRRRLLRNSYHGQFAAMRELGEKLSMIGGYGNLLLEELNPNPAPVYKSKELTASIKGAASIGLANYKGPLIEIPAMLHSATGLGGNQEHTGYSSNQEHPDTRLFRETHHHILQDANGAPFLPGISGFHSRRPSANRPPDPGVFGSSVLSPKPSFTHPNYPSLAPGRTGESSSTGHIGSPSSATASASVASVAPSQVSGEPQSTGAGASGNISLSTIGPSTGTLPSRLDVSTPYGDDQPPAYSSVSRG